MEAMVVMKTLKSFRYISVSLLTVSLFLFALACGSDSDDGESEETGGATTETGGTTDDGTGGSDDGSGGATTGTGGSSGEMDAGQVDGGKPLPTDVAEGGECTLVSMLFTAKGTCSSSTDCEGGLPTQFDVSGLGINPEVAGVLTTPENDQANCASGLTCCVNTDQCNAIGESLAANMMVKEVLGDSISNLKIECVAEGSCEAIAEDNSFGEIPTGCVTGQTCCVNVPPITLPELEGGTPTDAGASTGDANAES
jgi:hypothetical protein